MRLEPMKFVVVGKGYFPADMLRYDACYPTGDGLEHIVGFNRERVEVHLATAGGRAITPERWRSFGWEVVLQKDLIAGSALKTLGYDKPSNSPWGTLSRTEPYLDIDRGSQSEN